MLLRHRARLRPPPALRRLRERFRRLATKYVLGDPLDPATTLGPMARAASPIVRAKTDERSVGPGREAHIDPANAFPADRPGSPYLAPQVSPMSTTTMALMRDESFGPVVGGSPVDNDEEAIA